MTWQVGLASIIVVACVVALITGAICWRRLAVSRVDARAGMRALGIDLIRLPGRLRRLAADPRTDRRARWWLVGLAIYVASPIDPIPDFIPGLGHLDELVIVPFVLHRVRRLIPPEVWADHFPPRSVD